ncbi:Transcriptional regulatory protein [Rickettsiales bacterium Ac37b]|nr:Transcriptional regulatory protein [Rickettsiales bacterium Ac37b]
MNNIMESVFIYSNKHFITEIFAQVPNYTVINLKSLQQLKDIRTNNKFSLIIDSSYEEVNWKDIESVILQLKLIILLYDTSVNNIQSLSIPLNIPIIYMAMPFKFFKLISLINYYSSTTQENIRLSNNYSFSYTNKLLIRLKGEAKYNENIDLTEKEASLLKFLYNAQGSPISKNEILERIWGYSSILETHTLETHIYRLRQKLGEDAYMIYTYENKYGLKRHDFS